jgi:hypothetical protein
MTTNKLAQKLQIRPGSTLALLHAPAGFAATLDPLPEGSALVAQPHGRYPLVLLFAQNQAELEARIAPALAALEHEAIFWVAYPKKSSKVKSDLNRDAGWQALTGHGYRPVAQIALDETWAAVRFKPEVTQAPSDVVAAQFAGPKAALRPLYDQVAAAILALGPDIEVAARQSYVAFGRGKQFAQVRAATRDRLEIGLKLPDPPAGPRLQPLRAGSGSMTHKVDLNAGDTLDSELQGWLADAYRGVVA